jgi:hypothetical protein
LQEDPLEDEKKEEKDTKKKGEDGIFLYKFKLAKRRNARPSK